ncbi:MAG: sulfatase, partial [Planctomycetota bacterium]
IVPPGVDTVALEFHPWSLWIIVSQVAFALAAMVWILRGTRARLSGTAARAGPVSLLLALSLVPGIVSCADDPDEASTGARLATNRPDVYVLMADTFRADNLGLELSGKPLCPELDELAQGARRFTNAHTPATWTLPAHASLFTGLYPKEIGVVDAQSRVPPSLETLAETFAAAGYRTAAVTDAGYVSSHFGMDQGFESFVTTGNMIEPDFDLTVAAVVEALDRPEDDRPLFLFVQSYRAHSWTVSDATRERLGAALPFRLNEVFTSTSWRGRFLELLRAAEHGEPMSGSEFDDVVTSMIPNYRGASADASRGFGRVLAKLRAGPRSQESAVVFTSDHGEAFGLHGVVSHGNGVWKEQGHVPLLIAAAWITPGDDPRAASLIDLPRTLTALAGIEPVDAWRGTNLLEQENRPRALFQFQTLPAKTCYVAVIEGEKKWIFVDEGSAPGRLAFVYDLSADPFETTNLRSEYDGTDAEARARRALAETMETLPLPKIRSNGEPIMRDRLQKQLRGMGYGPR